MKKGLLLTGSKGSKLVNASFRFGTLLKRKPFKSNEEECGTPLTCAQVIQRFHRREAVYCQVPKQDLVHLQPSRSVYFRVAFMEDNTHLQTFINHLGVLIKKPLIPLTILVIFISIYSIFDQYGQEQIWSLNG